jgi:predicted RNA-binding protein with PIN domain
MHYLIDGHNLIAYHPDIELADPNDEVKLVLELRSWAAAGKKRRISLYFDGGLPGGRQADLSGGGLEVRFAPAGQPADHFLIRRIKKTRNPREYTLITNDRQIIQVARQRQMPVITAEDFARRLAEEREKRQAAVQPAGGEDPTITAAEVDEWLDLFGPVPERPKPRQQPRKQSPAAEPTTKKPQPAGELKTEGDLSTEDVAAWLELFGEQPKKPTSVEKTGSEEKEKKDTSEKAKTEGKLSDEDLAAWLEWFGSDS